MPPRADAHGNEPSHHTIFWWFRLGEPATAYRLLERAVRFYTERDTGLIGNDDAGALSAWLVCTALGAFPVDPTSAVWLTFRPRVRRAAFRPQRCDACRAPTAPQESAGLWPRSLHVGE